MCPGSSIFRRSLIALWFFSQDPSHKTWSKPVEAWFPEGKDDPTIALVVVHADTAEYWATDEPKAVVAFKIAKSVVTGDQPDVGENLTVEL